MRRVFFIDEIRDEIIEPVRRIFEGPIVIGGSAVGINPSEILERLGLDYAIRGDGEESFLLLLERLDRGEAVDDVPGLLWRHRDGALREAGPPTPLDAKALAGVNPADFVDVTPYLEAGASLQVQTKRGCALSCSYCTYRLIEGTRFRLRPPEEVAREVEELVDRTGCRRIELVDSTFNVPLGHAKAVLRAIIARALPVELSAMGLNPGAVDAELVDLLRRASFSEVALGADALSDDALASLGKRFTRARVVEAIELIQQGGLPLTVYLILGAPGETRRTLKETFETLGRVLSPWNMASAAVGLRVYRGSPLADHIERRDPSVGRDGLLEPLFVEPMRLRFEDLLRLTEEAAADLPNLFLHGAPTQPPPPGLVRSVCSIRDRIARGQPLWRVIILANWLARRSPVLRQARRARRWLRGAPRLPSDLRLVRVGAPSSSPAPVASGRGCSLMSWSEPRWRGGGVRRLEGGGFRDPEPA